MEKFLGSRWVWIAGYIGAYSYVAPDPHEHTGFAVLTFIFSLLVAAMAYRPDLGAPGSGDLDTPVKITTLLILVPWGFGLYNYENLNTFRAGTLAALSCGVVLIVGFIWGLLDPPLRAAKKTNRKNNFPRLWLALILGPPLGLVVAGLFFGNILFVLYVLDLFGVVYRFDPPWILFAAAAVIGLGWALKDYWDGL